MQTVLWRSTFVMLAVLIAALVPCGVAVGYVGRCAQCGTVDDVDAIAYSGDDSREARQPGAILGAVEGRAEGATELPGRPVGRRSGDAGERGTRLEIRMDKGGVRTIDVHGDPRIYRGDRVRVFRDRVELL